MSCQLVVRLVMLPCDVVSNGHKFNHILMLYVPEQQYGYVAPFPKIESSPLRAMGGIYNGG